ncbi:5'-nucleotidase, lipoprotein e(P4) family [Vibrio caribbeanicus]|uniref:5'-nucleotidase, lipoprotein e(P4) family n=1 Tax=Vibrio caribbeanicus TaxID=701175 RepID=UPI0030DA0435
MKTFALKCLLTTAVCGLIGSSITVADEKNTVNNPLLYSLAWKQTAAEYQALYYQGFNIAQMHLQRALAMRKPGDKPLAIISDLDDTLVLPLDYWGNLVNRGLDFFDDTIWDKWIPANRMEPSPGAKAFLKYCQDNNVEIFYITSRDQGKKTFDYALGNIKYLGFPLKDNSHLTVLRDTSNKQTRQDEIMNDYDVVVMLGDNLNDFRRKYYIKGNVEGRLTKMREDRDEYGMKYILFPNPTDGHWLAAIYGQSEPEASNENRKILKKSAAHRAWNVED